MNESMWIALYEAGDVLEKATAQTLTNRGKFIANQL